MTMIFAGAASQSASAPNLSGRLPLMTPYNPASYLDRRALASALVFKLTECGFVQDTQASGEKTFYRMVPGTDRKVVVYTTIDCDQVRSVGRDAIRICGVHKNSKGNWLGLVKNTRVNRTGKIDAIVQRMYDRMRDTYGRIMNPTAKCHCGALKFLAKSGNEVCSEFCWTKRWTER